MSLTTKSTDPTYKEWKRCVRIACEAWVRGTDPTYKEWKPFDDGGKVYYKVGTDPTYKEWKLFFGAMMNIMAITARILPTRNGNSCALSKPFLRWMARILPTRNGNQGLGATGAHALKRRTDPTYKEWKPRKRWSLNWLYSHAARILPTRNGNAIYGTNLDGCKIGCARILPTRNGNGFVSILRARLVSLARILPTRNGNGTLKPASPAVKRHGSYLQGMETGDGAR